MGGRNHLWEPERRREITGGSKNAFTDFSSGRTGGERSRMMWLKKLLEVDVTENLPRLLFHTGEFRKLAAPG